MKKSPERKESRGIMEGKKNHDDVEYHSKIMYGSETGRVVNLSNVRRRSYISLLFEFRSRSEVTWLASVSKFSRKRLHDGVRICQVVQLLCNL